MTVQQHPNQEGGQPDGGAPGGNHESKERLWIELFSKVLEREDIDRDSDFWELGGYSLLVPQVLSLYEAATGVRPSALSFFENSTPASLAAQV